MEKRVRLLIKPILGLSTNKATTTLTDQTVLFQIAQHDDAFALKFPNHPPKVGGGGKQRTLCCYVRIARLVTLHVCTYVCTTWEQKKCKASIINISEENNEILTMHQYMYMQPLVLIIH